MVFFLLRVQVSGFSEARGEETRPLIRRFKLSGRLYTSWTEREEQEGDPTRPLRIVAFRRGTCGVGWTMIKGARKVARSPCTLSNEMFDLRLEERRTHTRILH
jgi:hypothetical protein